MNQKKCFLSLLIGFIILPSFSLLSQAQINTANPKVMHIINRLSFGARPGDVEKIQSQGVDAYIRSQLTPTSIAEPRELEQKLSNLDNVRLDLSEILKKYLVLPTRQQGQQGQQSQRNNNQLNNQKAQNLAQLRMRNGELIMNQTTQARLLRAINSNRQLQEVMVDFWYNHFNVFAGKGISRFLVGNYEELAIRPYALGKFRQLLGATAKHPGMLFYLDNWQNSAPGSRGAKGVFKGLNENYARELMELHTMGVNGGYTQQDVVALAKILTGWGFPPRSPGESMDYSKFEFNPNRHDNSDKVLLGQTIKASGVTEGEQALDILARHPATARYISYKLAQYFVADNPPDSLVQRLAKRFSETDGDIRQVLDTLFRSPEFLDPKYYNAKFKTPYQFVISAIRATGVDVREPQQFQQISSTLRQLGMPLYGYVTPNGYKNTEEAWLNPDAMLRRINFATALSRNSLGTGKPVNSDKLSKTLGNNLSAKTRESLQSSPAQMQSALILGSPEFMRR